MRGLVLALLALNLALWFYASGGNDRRLSDLVEAGRLPRVATLEKVPEVAAGPAVVSKTESGAEPDLAALADEDSAAAPAPEAPESADVADATAPVMVDASTQAVSEAPVCFGVGWLESEEEARTLPLSEAFSPAGVISREVALSPFHWVVVPPLASRQAALARYRQLQERNIESYVVTTGEQENGISLGLFRTREAAERLLSRRQGQNIDATLVMQPRNRLRYALVFRASSIPSGVAEVLGQGGDGGQWELVEISACEEVASTEENP